MNSIVLKELDASAVARQLELTLTHVASDAALGMHSTNPC